MRGMMDAPIPAKFFATAAQVIPVLLILLAVEDRRSWREPSRDGSQLVARCFVLFLAFNSRPSNAPTSDVLRQQRRQVQTRPPEPLLVRWKPCARTSRSRRVTNRSATSTTSPSTRPGTATTSRIRRCPEPRTA